MTLIEILLALMLIALAATSVSFAAGATTRSQLRSACARVLSASRFAYARSVSTRSLVRIKLDLDAHTIALEEAEEGVTLARADEPKAGDQAVEATNPWEAARERLNQTFEPRQAKSPFGPIVGKNGKAIERLATKPLGSKAVRIHKVYVPHAPDPITAGTASLYYFPGGQTEHAVVQVTNPDNSYTYSVEIHPLTGRGTIYSEAFEPDYDWAKGEEDYSDLDDRWVE